MARRQKEHSRDPDLTDYVFETVHRTDNYAEQRGLEEILNQTYNPPLDKILPISSINPRAQEYRDAAQQFFKKQ